TQMTRTRILRRGPAAGLALATVLAVLSGSYLPASSAGPEDWPAAASDVQAEPPAAPTRLRLRELEARPYLLSASPIQNWPGEEPFSRLGHPPEYTLGDVAAQVDVMAVFVEHYGVPWPQFVAGAEPPDDHVWTRTMRGIAADAAAAGRPLSLQMVLSRDRVAGLAKATAGGTLEVDANWSAPCFDFAGRPEYGRAYARYVRWMV